MFKAWQNGLFDSHCHLWHPSFDATRDEIVQAGLDAEVMHILDVGIDIPTSKLAIENSKKYSGVVGAAVGIDPQILIPTPPVAGQGGGEFAKDLFAAPDFTSLFSELEQLIQANPEQVLAIGETGVDLYWPAISLKKGEIDQATFDRSQELQVQLFNLHLDLAEKFNLPLTIHSRGAEQLCIDLVSAHPSTKGIFHSFTGTAEQAQQIISLGWGVGVNAIVTYKTADNVREIVKALTQGKLLNSPGDLYSAGIFLETDAPYLKYNGKSEPANIAQFFQYLATIQ